MDNALNMVKIAYNALDEKKAEDIIILQINEISTIADYMIIANGSNISQVKALQDNVDEKLAKEGFNATSVEGVKSANWILMDFNDLIIHIFSKEDREFYNLERIWRDAKVVDVSSL